MQPVSLEPVMKPASVDPSLALPGETPVTIILIGLICLLAGSTRAQTTRTWTGGAATDWFNATNWTPAGIPAASDVILLTNGAINFSAPVTLSNQFYWSGGVLSGSGLTIAGGGAMTMLPPLRFRPYA